MDKKILDDLAEVFECRCGSEMIKVEYFFWNDNEIDIDVDEVFFSMFKFNYKPSRWFYIKQILKNGTPYLDQITFGYKELYRFKVHIDKIIRIMKKNELDRKIVKPKRPTGRTIVEGSIKKERKIITFPKRFIDEVEKVNKKEK